ncbi:MAG: ribokinase [Bacteroidales bacterium]|nr:ribokinase [Candidatus Liminaster caballi]
MTDICCIGHITKDKIITPAGETNLPGGTAYYFARGMQAVCRGEVSYSVLTAMADDDSQVVRDMQADGIDVKCLPSAATLFFENKYGADFNGREQRVLSIANPFTLDDIKDVDARYVVFGSLLAHDFPVEAYAMLHGRSQVVVDVQGYLREVRQDKVYPVEWADKHRVLPFVDVLKVNEFEMEVLTGTDDPRKAALRLAEWGVREVLLTFGSFGSLIYDASSQQFFDIPAYPPRRLVDATGCGDTYVTGYVFKRAQGASIAEAGDFAARVSSLKLENSGPLTQYLYI